MNLRRNHASGPTIGNAGALGGNRLVLQLEWKRLGLVIRILRTPALADLDRSGAISAWEAVWLGAALSLDAFGAGLGAALGAALVGLPALPAAACVASACGLLLYAGMRTGAACAHVVWLRKMSVLPGCMLILLGVLKWFGVTGV